MIGGGVIDRKVSLFKILISAIILYAFVYIRCRKGVEDTEECESEWNRREHNYEIARHVSTRCLGCLGVFVLIGIVVVVGLNFMEKGNGQKAPFAPSSGLVNAGENAVINSKGGGALSAITKAKMDELTIYANAGNEEAIQQMMNKGEVISIPNGTSVTIISRSGGKAQIEITAGEYKGMKVYTYIEMMKKK
ncbi:hypothetical protein D7Z26_12195 [Cohnella endophytica]|uniref:Uncharacterized protein n=1 Tax=Cohnella endophytica TaxID=2419778 RepID=A0A494XWA7_9BACL|nr:hypothetical protein [Cohnella endophytica]RKP54135.1 hypothetical protein D7Z26_12195 [Cohnella endophytica]